MRRDLERRLGAVEARRGRVALILRRTEATTEAKLIAGILNPEAYPLCDPCTMTDAELNELIDELQKHVTEPCPSREPEP